MEERNLRKIFSLILILILLVPLASSQIKNTESVRIGYSPEKLFNSETGTPTYIIGETIWIHSKTFANIELRDPKGTIITELDVQNNPSSVYKFKDNDELGAWELTINKCNLNNPLRCDNRESHTIELANQELQVNNNNIKFDFTNKSLSVSGDITPRFTNIPSESEIIISKQRTDNKITIPTSLSIKGSDTTIILHHSQDENGIKLFVQPYLEQKENNEEYLDLIQDNIYIWTELTSEVALVKKTGDSKFITYVDEPIVETMRTYMQITNTPKTGINISLPTEGNIDNPWTIPLKYGRSLFSVYLEFDDQIFVSRIPIVILENKIIINPDLIIPIDSFNENLNYYGELKLEEDLVLDFIFISKINGVDKMFYFSEKPSINKIYVQNELNERLENYKLVFDQNIKSIKINETTYVLTDSIMANPSLYINSFQVNNVDFMPSSFSLNDNSIVNIVANTGLVNIQIIDSAGSLSGKGNITINKLDSINSEEFITEWSGSSIDIVLPRGEYSAIFTLGDVGGETNFKVNGEKTDVIIVIDSIFGFSTEILIFILMTVITAELGIAYIVWKKALNR